MEEITTIEKPKTKKSTSAKTQIEEEGQVIVHCVYKESQESFIRIWKSTYLICNQNADASPLLHYEGITMYPEYSRVKANSTFNFTLYFKRLPKSCISFDLLEKIPEPGGFKVRNILRNDSDVYTVSLE